MNGWPLVIGVIAAVFMFMLGGILGVHQERLSWESRWEQRSVQDAQATAEQERQARAIEQQRQHDLQEIQAHATKAIDAARIDRDAAAAAADRLRQQVSALLAKLGQATRDTATAGSGPTSPAPGLLLTDVFGWSDARAGELAAAYDRARIAGLSCEAAYAALMAGQK